MDNHQHNVDLIKKWTGDLVVQDQLLMDDVAYIEYIPCKYCCAHAMTWKRSCVLTPEYTANGKPKECVHKSGASEMPVCSYVENDLGFLLHRMRKDNNGNVVMKDRFTLKLNRHFNKNNRMATKGTQSDTRVDYYSSIMGNQTSALYDIIHPTKFLMVVKETQECAGFDDTNHSYSTPSSAIPSGQILKKEKSR